MAGPDARAHPLWIDDMEPSPLSAMEVVCFACRLIHPRGLHACPNCEAVSPRG